MIIVRCIIGFFKTLVNIWSFQEWFYYVRTGLDPKQAAFERWELMVRVEDKVPETEAERVMPLKNRWVILRDKFRLAPDEVIYFTTDSEKVDNLMEGYQREMRTRTSGEFYYTMIKGRNLDYFHTIPTVGQPLVEGKEVDEVQKRDMFVR